MITGPGHGAQHPAQAEEATRRHLSSVITALRDTGEAR